MRRITTALALALCLQGCAGEPTVNQRYGAPTELLTGSDGPCGWLGPGPLIVGVLLADPVSGTAIKIESTESGFPYEMPPTGSTVPIRWPTGYTGHRLFGGEVEVRTEDGQVVATTGGRYALSPPVPMGQPYAGSGAFPVCEVGGEM